MELYKRCCVIYATTTLVLWVICMMLPDDAGKTAGKAVRAYLIEQELFFLVPNYQPPKET